MIPEYNLPEFEKPRPGIRLELEVAEVGHHDRVRPVGRGPGAQVQLETAWRVPCTRLETVALQEDRT